ncbi:NADAR family protein [Pontibacter sp. MBLB2868]|uniref:NADAR family protein n=1 Tax=Pontibacter sp. MBLB2868 TaxID=3451555 RepID=UPI003F7570B5
MISIEKKYSSREYNDKEVVWFRKTNEAFGGLSNMCSGYPLVVNGHKILTSEALYQACRFPDLPDVQRQIINEKSPMTAKMKSKPHRTHTRKDWDSVRIAIMRWSLQVKLAQNFIKFGKLLEETYPKQIVEDSRKDRFWGAVREIHNDNTLVGVNALGRLLMELRQKYMSENKYDLLLVEPLQIENFRLFGEEIQIIDERINFVNSLIKSWDLNSYFSVEQLQNVDKSTYSTKKHAGSNVNEPLFDVPQNNYKVEAKSKNNEEELVKEKIIFLLQYGQVFTSKDILKRVKINWSTRQMTSYLKKLNEVQIIEGSPMKFKLNQPINQNTLF